MNWKIVIPAKAGIQVFTAYLQMYIQGFDEVGKFLFLPTRICTNNDKLKHLRLP